MKSVKQGKNKGQKQWVKRKKKAQKCMKHVLDINQIGTKSVPEYFLHDAMKIMLFLLHSS